MLPLPVVRDLPRDFWSVRAHGLLMRLAEADLSESYDKGAPGTRRTLATGASALLEMVARGTLGGLPRAAAAAADGPGPGRGDYDAGRAEDLERAWDDLVQGLVYGDLVDGLFDHLTRTDDLEGHSPMVRAAADYVVIQ